MRRTVPRRPRAAHAHLPRRRLLARALRVAAVGLACAAIAGAGTVGYATYDLARAFTADARPLKGQDVDPPDLSALVDHEGVDLLLAGIDICEWESHERFGDRCPAGRGAYGDDGRELRAGLNDVNLLVHLSPEPRRITAVAFPRDLMIPTPDCRDPETDAVRPGSAKDQLNSAYGRGGLACVATTIDTLTTPYDPGLKVDYAATVTWNGVIEITNALGGVEVCVAETIDDVEAGMLHLEPGPHELRGEQALAFLRSRTGVGDGSDLGRISNQQVYMSALARKLTSQEVLSDVGTLLTLARTTVTNVDPSAELTPVALTRIALPAKDVAPADIAFVQYPSSIDPADANHVLPDEAAARELVTAVAAGDAFAPSRSDFAGAPTPRPSGDATTPDTSPGPRPTRDTIAAQGRTADDVSCAQGRG